MATDIQSWVQQSLQGDQQAFGKIVAQYQGAVSAMAYSITGNLAQSEDLAQEAFIVAWKKLGSLHNADAVAPWLCGIVRNLARDWMRKQTRQPTVSMEGLGGAHEPAGESPEEKELRRERADLVWSALAEIPENYREPLVLFYRQGESIRAIAEVLELTEDNVKQRLSRGRKMLRAEVAAMVETTLTDTRPGKAFTAGVLAALPALYGAKASAAEIGAKSARAAAFPTAAAAVLFKIALPAAALALVTLMGIWGTGMYMTRGASGPSKAESPRKTVTYSQDSRGPGPVAHETEEPALTAPILPATSNDSIAETEVSMSGVVVVRGSGAPPPSARVVLLEEDGESRDTLTGDTGRFAFSGAPEGAYELQAFARYGNVPDRELFSSELFLKFAKGEFATDLTIEVPPKGGQLVGRITDAKTGDPVAGIRVEVQRIGEGIPYGISGADGKYRVFGVQKGTSRVAIANENPLFVSNTIDAMETIVLGDNLSATVDIAIDRGAQIHGRVVDGDGKPVARALIDASLVLGKDRTHREQVWRMDCQTRADSAGEFTLWGAQPGDRAVASARNGDGLASHIAVVTVQSGEAPAPISLTLLPVTEVSGRFVDEQGRPVKAQLWYRAVCADGEGSWGGQSETRESTFTIALAQGMFELKGRSEHHDFGSKDEATATVTVGSEPIDGLVVNVPTQGELAGPYSLAGRVVDEHGAPLRDCRVYADLRSDINTQSFHETHTDGDGRFEIAGLLDNTYSVRATPGDPYEKFPGLDQLNPARTPELTIVARRAATIHGRVVDAVNGKPITRFELEYGETGFFGRETPHGPDTPSVNSDTGEFSFPSRPDMAWYLRVSAPAYSAQRVTGRAQSVGEQSEIITFRLTPSQIFRGTVTNSAGEPIEEGLVFVNDRDIGQRRGPDNAIAKTDADGAFVITSLPEEAEFAIVQKKGFASARVAIAATMRVILREGGIFEGHVTVGGLPPEGEVLVAAIAIDTPLAQAMSEDLIAARDMQFAKTTEDGAYRLEHLMNATYQLQITMGSGAALSRRMLPAQRLEAADGTIVTYDVDIPLGTAAIAGLVTSGGVPAAGAHITCINGDVQQFLTTGATGEYRFDGLAAGPVTIAAYESSEPSAGEMPREATSVTLEAKDGEVLQHDIALPRQ